MDEQSFLAVLLFPDGARDEFSVRIPLLGPRPPGLLHTATTFEGAEAIDVFRLADAGAWPTAAAYLYEQTIPGTVRDGAGIEQIALPDD